MLKKLSIEILAIFTILFAIPFSLSASSNPIVGVNFRIINYSYDEVVKEYKETCSSSQTSGTFTTNSNVTVQHNGYYTHNGSTTEPIYSTNSPIKGTFSLDGSSSCTLKSSVSNVNERSLIEYQIVLNDDYVGSISFTINGVSSTKYVNGSSIVGTINAFGNSSNNPTYSYSIDSFSLRLSNVAYSFPSESLVAVTRFNKEPVSFENIGQWVYPVFSFSNGEVIDIFEYPVIFCFYINKSVYSLDKLKEWFTIEGTIDDIFCTNSTSWSFVNIKWSTSVKFTCKSDIELIPIYFNYFYYDNISTEFALKYNLNNKELQLLQNCSDYLNDIKINVNNIRYNVQSIRDDLNVLLNGTTSSNNSVNNIQSNNSSFKEYSNQIDNIESNYSNSLDTNLNNIDTNVDFNVNGGGSYFLNSIKWVGNQFNLMTNKTPFGTLLGFSLIFGLAMLIIGRILR